MLEGAQTCRQLDWRWIHLGGRPKTVGKVAETAEPDQRKGATVPGAKDVGKDDRDVNNELEYAEAKVVQAAAGLNNTSRSIVQTLLTASKQHCNRCRNPRS